MNNNKRKKRFPYKDLLYKALILLGTVALIVYFMPREGKFNYLYEYNKPWRYGLLQASFDFPIYKDDAVAQQEQDSIMSLYQPYFLLDTDIEKTETDKLKEDYNQTLRSLFPSTDYVRHIERRLREIYSVGVMSNDNMDQLIKDSIQIIKIADNKDSYPLVLNNIFTIKKAYEYILNADTVHFDRNILRQSNLNEYITPNLMYDEQKSASARRDLINSVSLASGIVLSGQKIIDRGEIIDDNTYRILESLKRESMKRSGSLQQKRLILFGQILFVGILIFCFMMYLELFRKQYYKSRGSLLLLFAMIVVYCVLTALMVGNSFLNVYIMPFAMLPMIIRVFLDSRTAFMALLTTVLISSVILRSPYEFILLQCVAGLVAIFSLRELSQRSQLFRSALVIVISYVALYLAYEMIHESDLSKINFRMYQYFFINGILLLFTYPLLFLLEKIFGFTSNVTLVELSNINNNLLRQMSEVAPGTFQHSMQVANLAAEVANKIGAHTQLVRTGALYHDIGKIANPAFFTENQSGVNPHKQLEYKQSAQVVINHVKDGIKLAEKHNLPKVIKDFITTHHGLGKTKYFYVSYKNEHPDENIDEKSFTYPGPNPYSKEMAVLMMADSVEAASRSLPEYTEESISDLVDKIIDGQVADGYFKACPITFKDIATAKSVFKEKLKTMYHTRISYPEELKK